MISIAQEALAQLNRTPKPDPKREALLAFARQCQDYSAFCENKAWYDRMIKMGMTETVKELLGYVGRNWSLDQVKHAIKLQDDGMSYRQIGAEMGKSKKSVEYAVSKYRKLKGLNRVTQ